MAFFVPDSWGAALAGVGPELIDLARFVAEQRKEGPVYPPDADVLVSLELTPFDRVRVVLFGQDPYHGEGQAHGLAFSVPRGVKPPPSLANMMKELSADIGIEAPDHGCLAAWAERGVLLLNTVLTVRGGEAGSHRRKGWERVTSAIVSALNERTTPVVFALWGTDARKLEKLVTEPRHRVLLGTHPSPLSAHRGFFGSRPFTRIDTALREVGHDPIDWRLEGSTTS